MNKPKRIQRKRVKGWRMPANAIYVGRPTKWGNPFEIGQKFGGIKAVTVKGLLRVYRSYVNSRLYYSPHYLDELKGKNLACWCKVTEKGLRVPCHADVLLEIANPGIP